MSDVLEVVVAENQGGTKPIIIAKSAKELTAGAAPAAGFVPRLLVKRSYKV